MFAAGMNWSSSHAAQPDAGLLRTALTNILASNPHPWRQTPQSSCRHWRHNKKGNIGQFGDMQCFIELHCPAEVTSVPVDKWLMAPQVPTRGADHKAFHPKQPHKRCHHHSRPHQSRRHWLLLGLLPQHRQAPLQLQLARLLPFLERYLGLQIGYS